MSESVEKNVGERVAMLKGLISKEIRRRAKGLQDLALQPYSPTGRGLLLGVSDCQVDPSTLQAGQRSPGTNIPNWKSSTKSRRGFGPAYLSSDRLAAPDQQPL